VAIFGGGYDTATNNQHGRGLFVVDIANGAKLWEYKTTASAGAISTSNCTGSDDRACMNFSIPASPLALDLNNDGFIDKVYIGDVGGQMWKFNLEPAATLTGGTTGTVNNWQGKRFFRAGNDTNPPLAGEYSAQQAIYYAPDAAFDSNTSGKKLWIFFGTGDRNHPLNTTTMGSSTGNRFYGVKDDPYTAMTNNSFIFESPTGRTTGMVDATNVNKDTDGNLIVPAVGWYYVLSGTDKEKILARATVFNKVVYFTSFVPSGSAACGGGGIPRLYAVRMESAYAAIDWSSEHAYAASDLNKTNTRYTVVGAGIGSMPIITTSEDGTGTQLTAQVIVGGSGGVNAPVTLISNPAVPPDFMRRVLYWRERF
jgi:type IV pilus assembly protein PilY1